MWGVTRDFDDERLVPADYGRGRDWDVGVNSQKVPQGYEIRDGVLEPLVETQAMQRVKTTHYTVVADAPHLWPVATQEYARTGRYTAAAAALGCNTLTLRRLIKENEDFANMMAEAHQAYVAKIRAEYMRRAYDGVTRPEWYKGEVVGTTQEYSDRFLEVELRRVDPEMRELLAGPKGSGQTTVNVTSNSLIVPAEKLNQAHLTPEQRLAIRMVMRALAGSPTEPPPLDVQASEPTRPDTPPED